VIGRPPLLRRTNAQLLLSFLRHSGPCSKADLVRASGLSAPTVTNVVAHLASAGLVEPIGEGDSTGGRPPDILRFRAERGCVVGIEICSTAVHFLLADLDGRELGKSQVALSWQSSTPASVCTIAGKAVINLLRNHGQSDKQLLGAVAAVPAIVNVEKGFVLSLSALQGWRGVPLGPMLSDKLRCPTMIENDTNLAAQGEHYRGAVRGEANFVFVTIGDGVGAGIFLDGRIYHGAQWSAGEIGYLRVPQISRENPTMYGRGKLEKILGAGGILKSWRAAKHGARMPRVNRAVEVFDLAAAGNAHAKKILTDRATLLADVVLDMALILNPNVILLGGEVGNHPSLLQEVRALLKGSEIAVTRVALGSLGSAAVLWGAIYEAVESAIPELIPCVKVAG